MSTVLFFGGLAAWMILDNSNIGCLLLACSWLFHGGSPDDDDDRGYPVRYTSPNVNPPPSHAKPPAPPQLSGGAA